MADNGDIALMGHLLRRAGFGATHEELEEYAARSYEDVVEELLHPERSPTVDEDILQRMYGEVTIDVFPAKWIYRMINSKRPLEEKIALLWHHGFATGYSKDGAPWAHGRQIETFRRVGLLDMKTILFSIAPVTTMLDWTEPSG